MTHKRRNDANAPMPTEPHRKGELEFHLASDPEATSHDDAWRQERAKKLMKKHET